MTNISVLILSAGKGTRMKSDLPKVLHTVGGVPMVERVCRTVSELKPSGMGLVIGHQGALVKSHVLSKYPKAKFFTQSVLNGSGGAVRQATSWVKSLRGIVIVTCGDAPLISTETYKALIKTHITEKNLATVLTTVLPDAGHYGRIVRGSDNSVHRIVEFLDATEQERRIKEINVGTYCFDAPSLTRALARLKPNNAKGEYYLTDVLGILNEENGRVGGFICADAGETMGINSRVELSEAEAHLFRRKNRQLMVDGVTIIDPSTTYISDDVKIGADSVIYPQTFISGTTSIGSGCKIGPWAHINNCKIENNVIFKASFADQSVIRSGAKVGPYSHVRPDSELGVNTHMGNFSEVKKTRLGEGSKVNHLSYLGDSTVGKNVNIGAGTITCNYDGVSKHPTRIKDNVFVGSNANLIAPVEIGQNAVIGAGSTISDNVPAWALAVERSRAVIKPNWAKNRMKKGKKKK